MSADTLQTIASLAGLTLAAVGLPALFIQVRDLRRSIRSQAHAAIYAQAAEFRAHLVAYPELRRYFFDRVDIGPDHAEYDRVVTIAEILLNYVEHIAVMGDSFGAANRASLERFCRTALEGSPIVRRRLADHRAAYSDALTAYLPKPGRAKV